MGEQSGNSIGLFENVMNEVVGVTQRRNQLLRRATTASVSVALLLLLIKAYAWWISGSVSLLASLVDSAIDTLVSLINFMAVRYALQPADEEHRFGHGKAESLAGLAQSVFIMLSALFLLAQGVDHLLDPPPLQHLDSAITVMIISMLLTLCLVAYQRYVVARTRSVAIKADSLHYLSDLLTNAGIIVALVLSVFGWTKLDALLAIVIALYIGYTAIRIWSESIQLLLDRELPLEEQRKIENIALEHADVLGVHALRTRQSGATKIIQLHLELDGYMPLWRAHKVCDDVDQCIKTAYPGADVLIHQDPFRADPDRLPEPISEN